MLDKLKLGDIVNNANLSYPSSICKRVVFCKRLNCRALQNPMPDQEEIKFDDKELETKMASTFLPPSHLKLNKVGFQRISQTPQGE